MQPSILDAVVIGAGPAGASCAAWLARLGFSATVLEASDAVGGLCRRNPFRDDWNVSLPGPTGSQVADNLARSLADAGVSVHLECPVAHILPAPGHFALSGPALAQPLQARHVVIASGVRPRSPRVQGTPAVPLLVGPGDHIVAHRFAGQRVAVLGGGDNAFENALYALEHGASHVTVFARTVRAQRQFRQQLPASCVRVGVPQLDAVAGTVNGQPFDAILVFYGWEPCAPFAEALGLERSPEGFIATHPATAQTSREGLYAVGEVAQRQHPCVVTAMADGVTAAKAIQRRLEAA